MRAVTLFLIGLQLVIAHGAPSINPTDPGHLFIPMGKTYPSYSSWAVTVSMSMIPYRNEVLRIRSATHQLTHTLKLLQPAAANSTEPVQASLALALKRLSGSVKQLEHEQDDLVSTFGDTLSLPEKLEDLPPPPSRKTSRNHRRRKPKTNNDSTSNDVTTRRGRSHSRKRKFKSPRNATTPGRRVKRGLINGIGKIMSSLFGTATEGEISHLVENVQLIDTKEVAMAHAFNGTLRVLNSTRVATEQNRNALRSLRNAIQSMTESHIKLIQMSNSEAELLSISLQVADLAEAIHQVARSAHRLYSALTLLSDKLALAQVGILHADLISSRDLTRVLRKIDKSLPTNFALPFPAQKTTEYARIVKTKVVRNEDTYHVLFYIPLLHTLHAFDVYRFFPYHVPLHDQNVSLAYVPNEPRYLIISENRQQYIQPEDSEMEVCILAKQPFCQFHEPAYSAANAASCIVSLFRKDAVAITRYCSPIIRPTNDSPKAYYISRGKWLLVAKPPLQLTTVCPENSNTLSVESAVSVITLPIECSASSASIYLPPYYASETHLELPAFNLDQLVNSSTRIPIWRPEWPEIIPTVANRTNVLPPLHIDGMPADEYFNRIEAMPLRQVYDESPASFSVTWTFIIIGSLLAMACVCFGARHCCTPSRAERFLPRFRPAPTNAHDEHETAEFELLESRPQVQPQPSPQDHQATCPVAAVTATDAVSSRSPASMPRTGLGAFGARLTAASDIHV